jgi:diguanylate cyclase (GGDEF)-like protein
MSPDRNWIEQLKRWPRAGLYALFAVLTLVVATIDYLSGERFTVYVLYFPIIASACWLVGLRPAIVLSFFASTLWIADDIFAPPEPIPYLAKYWQATTRFLVFVSFAYSLSRLRSALSREQFLSHFDELTGLANRASLFEMGQRDVARCFRAERPLTAIFIDLDQFKEVNDRFGHSEGDAVLRITSETIRQECRESDLPARIGGDEFVVLAPEMTFEAAQLYTLRLQKRLREAMEEFGWPVTFSIGAATYNSPPPNLDQIIKTADDLMYTVKHKQKNAVKHILVDEPESAQIDVNLEVATT